MPWLLQSVLVQRQLGLAPFLAGPLLASRYRLHRRLDAERRQQPHDLGSDRLIDPQRAEL